ncbi:asparagine synthase (glutamine-hydrolyzing) [Thermodesulfobacteriota bacterium]
MCGICGFSASGSRRFSPRDIAEKMCDTLAHRGPDDSGVHVGRSAVLGHRRLSIIDLAGGRQPILNEDDTIAVVANGEIYNYRELTKELKGLGHRFSTRSDSETLVHAYEEWGADCLDRIDGMFAFAVYDSVGEILMLVRDRMGKKPLYYTIVNGTIVFASEIKAIVEHPDVRPELDPASLAKYLAYEYVPTPRSILKGVNKLPGGTALFFDLRRRSWEIRRYWDCTYASSPAGESSPRRDVEACAEGVRRRLEAAVKRRLMSDVPLGVYLSGGIDSSAIVYFMSRLVDPGRIKTFSVGFEEASFDESGSARRVADHFGTDHHEEILNPSTLLEILPRIVSVLDEPFADASIVPTFLLSRFTGRSVTVALGGDGGDELFAGYPTFQAHRVIGEKVIPAAIAGSLRRLADLLPVSTENISFDFKVKQFLLGLPYDPGIRNQVWLGSFTPAMIGRLLKPDVAGEISETDPYSEIASCLDRVGEGNFWDRLSYLYARMYLQDDILVKVDRASMAYGLEVRAPFLDRALVEYVNRIPHDLKLRGFTTKYILKRAMRGKLPRAVVNKPKKGFGIPVAKWFKKELRDEMLDTFSAGAVRRQGIFEQDEIDRLVGEHLSGHRDNRKLLWTLFMFQKWCWEWGWA